MYGHKYKERDPNHKIAAPVVPCSQRLRAIEVAANAGVALTGPKGGGGGGGSDRKRKLDTSWTKDENRTVLDTFVPQNCVVRAVAVTNFATHACLTHGRADRRAYPAITINVHDPRLAITVSTIRASTGTHDVPAAKLNVTGAETYVHALLQLQLLRNHMMKFPHRHYTPDEIRRGVDLQNNVFSCYMVNMCMTARLSFPIDMDDFNANHPDDMGKLYRKKDESKSTRRKKKKQKTNPVEFPGAFWPIPASLSCEGGDRGFEDQDHRNLAVVFGGGDGANGSMNLMGMITGQAVKDATQFIPAYMRLYEKKKVKKQEEEERSSPDSRSSPPPPSSSPESGT
jgi:hypothetical protein